MLQDRILPPQPLQFSMQINRSLTRLADIPLLTEPPCQRRQSNAKIFRNFPPRPKLVSASRTASRRYSDVGLFQFP